MKKMGILVTILFSVLVMACGGSDESEDIRTEAGDSLETVEDTLSAFDPSNCGKETPNDFNNFLRIRYGATSDHLLDVFGEPTKEEFTDDSSNYVYFFRGVENAPVTVWTNAKSKNVEMIFFEVVSFIPIFHEDRDQAAKKYDIQECDSQWFGMTQEEVLEILGAPHKVDTEKDGNDKEITNFSYDSDDYSIAVNFKFYESQDNICSSVTVNWFY